MALKNKWVGYFERGYIQIKQSILNRIRTSVPEITDFSESNIFVIIASMFSGLLEQLHYYIDQLMRESFIVTARRYESVVKHSRQFDYRIKAANPASTIITLNFIKGGESYTLTVGEEETLPKGTIFTSSNGLTFVSTKSITVGNRRKSMNIPVSQFSEQGSNFVINSTEPSQSYDLGLNYVHNSISLLINGQPWQQVTSFGKSLDTDTHYIIDIGLDGRAYIVFGDDIRGLIPPLNGNVNIQYNVTAGVLGNLGPGSIGSMDSVTWDYIDSVELNQYNSASGGTGYETIERIRVNVPLSLRTLERAVTKKDYVDVATLHPGVNKSYVQFDCGKYVDVYISPMGGGIAQQPLLDSVKDWLEDYRMVTTFINPKSAGESKLVLVLGITGRFRMKEELIESQAINALLDDYGYEKSDINKSIRKSDIYALVDNQPSVDYLMINKMYLIPYLFPQSHNVPFNMQFEVLQNSETLNYNMVYLGSGQFQIQKDNVYEGEVGLSAEYNNGIFKLTPLPGGYVAGMIWDFKVYPINDDIVIDDNSIPVLEAGNLHITIQTVISK